MLLTRHKLLLAGIVWFGLAVLALAGLVAYAVLNVPLPPVPPTAVALALVQPPTVAQALAPVIQPTAGPSSTPSATNTLVVRSPTPSATSTSSDTPTETPTATNTARPTRTRRPTPTATDINGPAAPGNTQPPRNTAAPSVAPPPANTGSSPTNTVPPAPLPSSTGAATRLPPTAPPPPPPVPIADFWGVNGGPIDGNNSADPFDGDLAFNAVLREKSFDWMNQAGLRWFRNYGSDGIVYSWRFVEPAPGVYDWRAWDSLVLAAQQHDVNLLASIGNGVPQWANGSANWRAKPTDLYTNPMAATAFYQYVQHIVERYDGDGVDDMPGLTRPIKFWELWNEPDLRGANGGPASQFDGTVKDYVRLSQVGYSAVKAADPGAQVVGPSTSQAIGNTSLEPLFLWSWADWMAAGGLSAVDIVSFHLYPDANRWDASGGIDHILDGLDANRGGKPVWETEIGWAGGVSSGFEDKDNNFVRSVVLFWQRPAIQRYFWYDLLESETYDGSNNKGLMQSLSGGDARGIEPDPLFHPIYRVAESMARMLAGFGAPSAVDVGGAARAYHFSGGGRDVWVVWKRDSSGVTTVNIDTGGRQVQAVGVYGEASGGAYPGGPLTVGAAPVYLTTQLDWNPNLGSVAGRVRHAGQAGQWADGAGGVAIRLSGPVNATVTTAGDGTYRFTGLPDGNYTVAVAGADPASQNVTVARNAPWGRTSFVVP